MSEQEQDDQLEHTYSSSVRIRDVALKTCQRRWTIGKSVVLSSADSSSYLQNHNDTIIKTQEDFFINIFVPLTLFVRVRKGYSRFACERELETEQKLQYFDPHSYGRQRCVLLVLLMLNWRPWGPLCWVMAFFTTSYQHLLWTPIQSGARAPFGLVWLFLPHLVYNSVRSPTATVTSVLTELYNSSTPIQSPTRSLKSHVWSSSSGNNFHAVHRSLSSGASVYECTTGIYFLPRPISSANFRPRDFLS